MQEKLTISSVISYLKTRKLHPKLIFIFVGTLSTIWFLVRVIPKPSRATYPCLQAAAPFMSGFVIYLLSLVSTVLVFKRARTFFYQSRYLLFLGAIILGSILSVSTLLLNKQKALAATDAVLEEPNQPVGSGVGIHPGRVSWVHAPDATNENCENVDGDYWSDDKNTNQAVVDQMVSEVLQNLSGTSSDAEAWTALFTWFNSNHDRGNAGYTAGEKIVIKLNLNTASRDEGPIRPDYRTVDTSPQLVYAILNQLIQVVGVQASDISIGDPGRTLDNIFWDKCHADFPEVNYWGKAPGRTLIEESDEKVFHTSDGSLNEFLPKSYVEAQYMINIPVMKKHHRGGISLSSKNHFGTFVPFNGSASHLHYSLPVPNGKGDVSNGEYGAYRIFVDFMGHKDLGGKTILYLMDGLWTTTNWAHPPIKWGLAPFNSDYPASIFASQDPVAIESVGFDFLREEFTWDHPTEGVYDPTDHKGPFPQYDGVDDFLHQAADSANWPAGIIYDPENDGTPVPESMGVHEHWNNAADKQYTRNLGGDEGIELVYIEIPSVVGIDGLEIDQSDGLITLLPNYPNPFSLTTSITYTIASSARVNLTVYDAQGRLVQILRDGQQDRGEYSIDWDGTASNGSSLNTGVYYGILEAKTGGQINRQTIKIIISR
ncbi:MAG: DUF362 domain-containing protein [Bacteroidetes bacterium]|nr:DUF362 domain-containing protein [Bacteroidota bacterium]